MKAVVFKGKQEVSIEDVDSPAIQDPRDAVLKVTSAAICGSDLHMYDGRTTMSKGAVFGHEIMGIIDEVGPGVSSIQEGDRVVLTFNISCGYCFNCVRGYTSACLTTNDLMAGAAYGYDRMGDYRGGQAEYVRVPFADFNCIKLPGRPGDEFEDDFLMLADIFPTAFHATELAKVGAGSTVAIYGAGPVGLLAAHCSILKGAAQVFVVDGSPTRLKIAQDYGAIPIDYKKGDPAEQIIEMRRKNPLITRSFLPGEEKMIGVMCGIEAVGFQMKKFDDPDAEDPNLVMNQLIDVVNPTGSIGVVGVYASADPKGPNAPAKKGQLTVNWGKLWEKGISLGTGQTPVKHYALLLREMIIGGKAKPSRIISHRIPLDQAPEAYKMFDLRGLGDGEEYTKVVLKPGF